MRRVHTLLMWAVLLPGVADAARLRIVAPSEIQVDPRLSPDRGGLDVDVRVRNDRRAPVRGAVVLRARAGSTTERFEASTDRDGAARFHVPLGIGTAASVQLQVSFAGTQETAPSERVVEVTSQYMALDLPDVPPIVDIDDETLPVVVSVRVADGSAGDREVQLLAGDRPLGRGFTDASGRAVINVAVRDLGPPGVRELVASYQLQGVELSRSAPRRIVVRARTTLTAEKARGVDGEPGEANAVVIGALSTRLGPVAHAPVRLLWGSRVVGATLTDEGGTYAIPVDPEVTAQPGAEVTAAFAPSEPWYQAAESAAVQVSPPAPRSVDWRLASVPACIAALALAAARLRRRAAAEPSPEPPAAVAEPGLARVADAPREVCRVRVHVSDAATRAPIESARVRWQSPDLGERDAAEVVDLAGGGAVSITVSAPGYAPRTLAPTLARGGEYALRVPLRTWREELFELFRGWVRARAATGGRVLPTPREALARGRGAEAEELLMYVEQGSYGPDVPDEGSVRRAESLAAAAEGHPAQRER